MKLLQLVAVVVACALILVGCRSMTGRSVGQQVDDKVVTSQVKTKLVTDRFANAFSTGVGTQFGVVHLTGTVHTPEQRTEAERIATRVPGAKRVVNEIVVVPRDQKTAKADDGSRAAASPATARPVTLSGQVTSIDAASGDVTVKTQSGDVVLRLPTATAQSLEQGQQLSINAGATK
jgi:hyperosmotically inducible periplasmic protein